MKKKIKKEKNYFSKILTIFLCLFIFLRIWYDGISYPLINLFLVLSLFSITIIVYLIQKKYTEDLLLSHFLFFLFILFSIISSGISPVKGSGIFYNANILSFLCLIILVSKLKDSDTKYLIYTLFFTCFVLGIYGIYQYYWGLEITREFVFSHKELLEKLPPTFLERLESNRIFSRFIYPNIYASFLLTVLPLLYFTTFEENFYIKFFSWVVFFIAFYNLILTGSIGGLLVFIFVFHIIVLFLIFPEKIFIRILPILFIIEILIATIAYKVGIFPHIHSFIDRLRYWKSSIYVFKEKPLVGVGPENFRFLYLKYKLPQSMEAKHAHSLFFETLTENGILGVIFLFSFLFLVPYRAFKNGKENFYLYGMGFSFISLFLHNMIDFDFVDPSSSFLFFLLAGISSILLKEKSKKVKLTLFPLYFIIILLLMGAGYLKYSLCLKNIEYSKNFRDNNLKIYLLDKAEKFYPYYEVYFLKGKIFYQMGIINKNKEYLKESEKQFLTSIYLNPYFIKGYRELAFLYQNMGKIRESERMYLKLIELYPNKKQFNLEIAMFYKSINKKEEFEYFYEKSKKLVPVSIEEKKLCERYEKWIKLQK